MSLSQLSSGFTDALRNLLHAPLLAHTALFIMYMRVPGAVCRAWSSPEDTDCGPQKLDGVPSVGSKRGTGLLSVIT